jgi:hypothetical protein
MPEKATGDQKVSDRYGGTLVPTGRKLKYTQVLFRSHHASDPRALVLFRYDEDIWIRFPPHPRSFCIETPSEIRSGALAVLKQWQSSPNLLALVGIWLSNMRRHL